MDAERGAGLVRLRNDLLMEALAELTLKTQECEALKQENALMKAYISLLQCKLAKRSSAPATVLPSEQRGGSDRLGGGD